MTNEHTIICGGVTERSGSKKHLSGLRLEMWGKEANVHFKPEQFRKVLFKDVTPELLDLIDIAVYVYTADQSINRCNNDALNGGALWRRDLSFHIPVRKPMLWRSRAVQDKLVKTLSFLSEDSYHFHFQKLQRPRPGERYFDFDDTPLNGVVEEVVLFSGGLDSLAGAVQESIIDRRKVLLINHRSTEKVTRRHDKLLSLLDGHASSNRPIHLPVRINKEKQLGRDYTQRARSFLYASLAAVVAHMIGLPRIRFYENGVISLNLPPSPQVIGARATRTTHPQVLNGFADLFSQMVGTSFRVENPFLWKTKTEVVQLIANAGCGDMIRYSTSCTHTWEMTKQYSHCGGCSQCIDRRFAVLAANAESEDPGEAYKTDLLVGDAQKDVPRAMLAAYVEKANEVERMTSPEFFQHYGEASRVLRHLGGNADETASKVFELHKRHAAQVTKVIDNALARFGPAIRRGELPPVCLIRLVCDSTVKSEALATKQVTESDRDEQRPASDYLMVKSENLWRVRFAGGDLRHYIPGLGFDYLWELIQAPGKVFSATELSDVVQRRLNGLPPRVASPADYEGDRADKVRGALGFGRTDSGEAVVDDLTEVDCQARLKMIREAIQSVEETQALDRQERIEQLLSDQAQIQTYLSKAFGRGNRPRRLGDEQDKARLRVSNAVRRVLDQIKRLDPELFAHLQRPVLSLGKQICYSPTLPIEWVCAPEKSIARIKKA